MPGTNALRNSQRCHLTVDIGGTKTAVAVGYEDGQILGDGVVIATVEVLPPHRQPDREDISMKDAMVAFPDAGVTLMGHAAHRSARLPGEWDIDFFWRADRDNPSMRVRDLVFLDAAGKEVWRVSGEPTQGAYGLPPNRWLRVVFHDDLPLCFSCTPLYISR